MLILSSKTIQSFFKVISGLKISNPMLPILENVVITVLNGRVTFRVTDLNTEIIYSAGTTDCSDCSFCVIAESLKKLTKIKGDYKFSLHGDKINIGSICLNSECSNDFPVSVSDRDVKQSFNTLFSGDLSNLSELVEFTSTDMLRPAMQGVYFDLCLGLSLVATNAHLLKVYHVEIDRNTNCDSSFLIDKVTAKIVSRLGDVVVLASETYVSFVNDFFKVTSRKMDEKYPAYKEVLPATIDKGILVNRLDLINSLGACLVIANKTTKQVVFSIGEKLVLESSDIDFGNSCTQELVIDNLLGDFKIGFNGKLMIDVLKAETSTSVFIQMTDAKRPCLIETVFSKVILMPVLLFDKN